MKTTTRVLTTLFSLLFCFKIADAQYRRYGYYETPWNGIHTHQGLFVSAGDGIGGLNYNEDTDNLKLSGGAANFDFKIGGAIVDNLILSGDFFSVDASNPNVSLNGGAPARNYDYVSMHGLGIGLTYYFMPVNIYLSGTLGSGVFNYNEDISDNGVAVQLQAGKEWWVSRNWGLGIALDYTAMGAKWSGNDNAQAGYFGLMFSSTFN